MENITIAERNKLSFIYGFGIGGIFLLINTGINTTIGNMAVFWGLKIVSYILYFVLIGVLATKIKRANGGYIEFRDLFGAIFIMILASELVYFIYNFVYIKYIDPHFMEKYKASSLEFMERMKFSDDKIERASHKFDKTRDETQHFNLGNNILSYFEYVISDSLLGLIVCLILKKPRPVLSAK